MTDYVVAPQPAAWPQPGAPPRAAGAGDDHHPAWPVDGHTPWTPIAPQPGYGIPGPVSASGGAGDAGGAGNGVPRSGQPATAQPLIDHHAVARPTSGEHPVVEHAIPENRPGPHTGDHPPAPLAHQDVHAAAPASGATAEQRPGADPGHAPGQPASGEPPGPEAPADLGQPRHSEPGWPGFVEPPQPAPVGLGALEPPLPPAQPTAAYPDPASRSGDPEPAGAAEEAAEPAGPYAEAAGPYAGQWPAPEHALDNAPPAGGYAEQPAAYQGSSATPAGGVPAAEHFEQAWQPDAVPTRPADEAVPGLAGQASPAEPPEQGDQAAPFGLAGTYVDQPAARPGPAGEAARFDGHGEQPSVDGAAPEDTPTPSEQAPPSAQPTEAYTEPYAASGQPYQSYPAPPPYPADAAGPAQPGAPVANSVPHLAAEVTATPVASGEHPPQPDAETGSTPPPAQPSGTPEASRTPAAEEPARSSTPEEEPEAACGADVTAPAAGEPTAARSGAEVTEVSRDETAGTGHAGTTSDEASDAARDQARADDAPPAGSEGTAAEEGVPETVSPPLTGPVESQQPAEYANRLRVSIGDAVIAKIAATAARQVPGVYGVGRAPQADDREPEEVPGVTVQVKDGAVAVKLDLVVEYGAVISAVTGAVGSRVISSIENFTGFTVDELTIDVDVHVGQPEERGS